MKSTIVFSNRMIVSTEAVSAEKATNKEEAGWLQN